MTTADASIRYTRMYGVPTTRSSGAGDSARTCDRREVLETAHLDQVRRDHLADLPQDLMDLLQAAVAEGGSLELGVDVDRRHAHITGARPFKPPETR